MLGSDEHAPTGDVAVREQILGGKKTQEKFYTTIETAHLYTYSSGKADKN